MLHVIGLSIMLIGLFLFIYLEAKNIRDVKSIDNIISEESEILLKQRILQEKRKEVIDLVHSFLKNAKFIKPIAIKEGERIYQYIYVSGFLYEFKEILSDSNKRLGKDAENLCFRDLSYTRVNNPEFFVNSFVQLLSDTPLGNPNVEDGGLGLSGEDKVSIIKSNDKEQNNQAVLTA